MKTQDITINLNLVSRGKYLGLFQSQICPGSELHYATALRHGSRLQCATPAKYTFL